MGQRSATHRSEAWSVVGCAPLTYPTIVKRPLDGILIKSLSRDGGRVLDIPAVAEFLRVYLNASDRVGGRAVYKVVVEAARRMHLAGASVFLVDYSYGVHGTIRDARSEYLSFEIPVAVEIIDAAEKIGELLTALDPVIVEGLVVRRPVRVVRYAGRSRLDASGLATEATMPHAPPTPGSPAAMKIEGDAQRLTVYVGNSDAWRGRNLAAVIVEKCRELGMAGATATVGVMGFGKTSRVHRAHLLGLSEDLPERIEVVDRPEQIARLLPALEPLVQGGLIVVEDVRAVRYRHAPRAGRE